MIGFKFQDNDMANLQHVMTANLDEIKMHIMTMIQEQEEVKNKIANMDVRITQNSNKMLALQFKMTSIVKETHGERKGGN